MFGYNEYEDYIGKGYEYEGGNYDSRANKMPKPTQSNIKVFISWDIQSRYGLSPMILQALNYVKIDEKPQIWKHSCIKTGVIIMSPILLEFFDGTLIEYTYCPECCKVIYYVEPIY